MHRQSPFRDQHTANQGIRMLYQVRLNKKQCRSFQQLLASLVAVTTASSAIQLQSGLVHAQEKTGVAISLSLTPAAPEVEKKPIAEVSPAKPNLTVVKQPAATGKTGPLGAIPASSENKVEPDNKSADIKVADNEKQNKQVEFRHVPSNAANENPFALSAFEHPVKVLMNTSAGLSKETAPSQTGKHQIGQLVLVDPREPSPKPQGSIDINLTLPSTKPREGTSAATDEISSDSKSTAEKPVDTPAKTSSDDDFPEIEVPPSPTKKPTAGKTDKQSATSTSKPSADKVGNVAQETKEKTAQGKTAPKEKSSEAEQSKPTAANGASKSVSSNTTGASKSIGSSGKTSRKRIEFDNEDAEEDASNTEHSKEEASADDVPLEQESHPYDAPKAESNLSKPDRPLPKIEAAHTREQLKMRDDINRCLTYYMEHLETTTRRSPWAVMHTILPFGVEAELGAGNRRVNAIGWMCYNGLCKTQRMFQPTTNGFRTNLGPGVQGHEGQFLAILAQSKVASNYPIKMGNRNYTINDLVRYEMASCREKSELTFKLIGLSYYLDQNQVWRDNRGGTWSLEKLVAQELDQPVVGAACGGTHRLMGLTFSLLQHKQAGLPVTGHWQRSEQYLNEFVAYAMSLQNPDGSFSTEWFEARANEPNVERKVQTTGHTLEWLVYTLPDEQLQSPQVTKAVQYLLNTIGAEPGRDWPIGPRGHSLRALALYNQRVFGAQTGKMRQFIANTKSESQVR